MGKKSSTAKASFTTTALTQDRVIVRGTDIFGATGEVVLDGRQWSELNDHGEFAAAEAAFNEAIEEFFAPLTDATDALNAAAEAAVTDGIDRVVVQEAVAATPGRDGIVQLLSHDSIILRLLDEGGADRLVWVNDNLEVLAA